MHTNHSADTTESAQVAGPREAASILDALIDALLSPDRFRLSERDGELHIEPAA